MEEEKKKKKWVNRKHSKVLTISTNILVLASWLKSKICIQMGESMSEWPLASN